MTELDQLISKAYASQGETPDVNKVYLAVLRTLFYLPVAKGINENSDEPFRPLFTKVSGQYFVLAFDTYERLQVWAGEQFSQMSYVEISGKDLVSGLNENVYFCINYGTEFYKEFSPDELKRLKMIASRIDQMK